MSKPKVTVADAIKTMESALQELKELDPTLEVQGNFDQGPRTYGAEPLVLDSIRFGVSHYHNDSWGVVVITAGFWGFS